MPREISSAQTFWARVRGDALSGDGSGDNASNPLAFEQFNRDIGALDSTAATSDTANTGLISLVKRLLLRVSNLHAVQCTGAHAGGTGDNAAVTGTIPAQAGKVIYVKGYSFSFGAAPGSAVNLSITSGGSNIVDIDVITGGPGPVPVGVAAAADTPVTYSLGASGTGGNVGRLKIYYAILDAI